MICLVTQHLDLPVSALHGILRVFLPAQAVYFRCFRQLWEYSPGGTQVFPLPEHPTSSISVHVKPINRLSSPHSRQFARTGAFPFERWTETFFHIATDHNCQCNVNVCYVCRGNIHSLLAEFHTDSPRKSREINGWNLCLPFDHTASRTQARLLCTLARARGWESINLPQESRLNIPKLYILSLWSGPLLPK